MKKPPITLGAAPMAAALRRYIMAGIILLATTLFATEVSAQTYDYPFANSTSCSASVEFWYEYTCGVDNLNGYASFTVPANSTVTHTIPSTASPEKIYVTVGISMATWLCPNTSFSPASLNECSECSNNRITVQGYSTATRIDCM